MSQGRRGATPIVSRAYTNTPDACVRALTALLKKPVSNEGSPTPATLGNDGRIKGDSAGARILPK
jgi:hypothetical protein